MRNEGSAQKAGCGIKGPVSMRNTENGLGSSLNTKQRKRGLLNAPWSRRKELVQIVMGM